MDLLASSKGRLSKTLDLLAQLETDGDFVGVWPSASNGASSPESVTQSPQVGFLDTMHS